MPYSSEVINVSDSSEPEASSSRKHDRHEKDPQVEGPNKRHKQNRGSEPPMRKDATMTPRAKGKKSRKEINHDKASRTSNHQKLKERVKALECELKESVEALECKLKSARQAHDDENRENQANLDWHATQLKIVQARCSEQADEIREKKQTIETQRQENETLTRKSKDTAKDAEVARLSCQIKDDELKGKEEVIAAKQKELDDSKSQSASLEEVSAEMRLQLAGKDEIITSLQKELDDSRRQTASLEKSSTTMRLNLGEQERALKAAKRDQSDCRKQLALTDEKLRSRDVELDQANTAREKIQKENEALHVINDQNGHRNHNTLSREKRAKDALESLKTGELTLNHLE